MSTQYDYNDISATYDNERFAAGSDVMCSFMQYYTGKPLQTLHILDAGCGTGIYAKSLIENGVKRVTLFDASEGMLEVAKARLADYEKAETATVFVKGAMPPLPFPGGSFDVVMFNLVFNHLYQVETNDYAESVDTLKEARRVLRPGGVILISTILRSTGSKHMWPVKVDKPLGERYVNMSLSLEQFEEMFNASDISCKQKMNLLGSDIFPNYFKNPESYLTNFLFFLNATDSERNAVLKAISEIKSKVGLQRWIKENDSVNEYGLLTIFICKSK